MGFLGAHTELVAETQLEHEILDFAYTHSSRSKCFLAYT